MTNARKCALFAGLFAIVLLLGWANRAGGADHIADTGKKVATSTPALSHAQEVWLGALEWCESRGNPVAVNKVDRDGTPSYGAFQFKPDTLWYFADLYGIEKDPDYMLYGQQRAVVEAMVLHRKEISWSTQFPDCVKKLGAPPA